VTQPIPLSVQLSEEAFNKPLGPLVLESVSIGQDPPSEQVVRIEAHVTNRGAEPIGGRAQFVIGRFVDPEPFRTALWQTDWLNVPPLQPGESDTLTWKTPIGLPAGTYGLSVWVHTRTGSTFDHSHATFNIPLRLEPNALHVQRVQPASGEVHVRVAHLDAGNLRLVIDNAGPERAISASAARLPVRRRFDWSIGPLLPTESVASFVLPAQATRDVQLAVQVDCAAEYRLVHVTLFSDASAAAVRPVDDVLVDVCS
jgi:hypothetical protein